MACAEITMNAASRGSAAAAPGVTDSSHHTAAKDSAVNASSTRSAGSAHTARGSRYRPR